MATDTPTTAETLVIVAELERDSILHWQQSERLCRGVRAMAEDLCEQESAANTWWVRYDQSDR